MAQQAIREYDAKTLWSRFSDTPYVGNLVETQEQLDSLIPILQATGISSFVVKPDQLFGKRGKYGLVGVNLDAEGVAARITERWQKTQLIKDVEGKLNVFLIEPFVPHEAEYYVAIKTEPDTDIMYFSTNGGVDVEENWENVDELKIDVLEGIQERDLQDLVKQVENEQEREKITNFLLSFYAFFKDQGCAYLEVNPLVIGPDGSLTCLDMVARLDTCEAWKQKGWGDISGTKGFGSVTSDFEHKVEKMDAETGASLKFVTLNPEGNIGLLLGSGGASIAIMDTFARRGMIDDLINYGELSGNPNYRHNKEYVQGVFDMLYASSSSKQKYLCYLGPIANFTRIDVMGRAFVDALQDRVAQIKEQNIKIVVRRGGVNDTKGLKLIKDFCESHDIPCKVSDGDVSITEAMKSIK